MVRQNESIERDRTQHPTALTPDYKIGVLRSPRLPPWSLQNSLSEVTGSLFKPSELGPLVASTSASPPACASPTRPR